MKSPALPYTPACWSWLLPPLPISNSIGLVERWQAGRCAVCAVAPSQVPGERPVLYEDHDHITGRTRGYLCPRCNTAEGSRHPKDVFLKYRDRNPTSILGVLHQKGRWEHPDTEMARKAWARALEDLDLLDSEETQAEWRYANRRLHERGDGPELPLMSPLMTAAKNVGLTLAEWQAAEEARHVRRNSITLHLPDSSLKPRAACGQDGWRGWPGFGLPLLPCPECFFLDPEEMAYRIGPDRRGVDGRTVGAIKCQDCWRDAVAVCEFASSSGGRSHTWCATCAGTFIAEHARNGRSIIARPLTPGPILRSA